MGDRFRCSYPPPPPYKSSALCQNLKNTSPCDALHVQEIVEMANSFPKQEWDRGEMENCKCPTD